MNDQGCMTKGGRPRHLQLLHALRCSSGCKPCETHLKGPLSVASLHATIAHGKPALREQGVQPQRLLPVPLSLRTKNDVQHVLLRVQDESGVSCLDSMKSSMHDAVGWTGSQ